MNCKPGDLAVIVHCEMNWCKAHLGKVVRCLRLVDTEEQLPGWETDPELHATDDGSLIAWADEVLRPIQDPGDDAVDEMVQKLGKPEGVTA